MDMATLGIAIDARQVKNATDAIDDMGTTAGVAERSVLKMALAFGSLAAIDKAVDSIREFSREMAALAAISEATAEQMGQMREQAKLLGAATSFSAADAARAQKNLAAAGLEVNAVLKATPTALKLAQAGQLDLAESSELLADTMSQAGLSVEHFGRISDVLVKTANVSTSSVRQLGEGMKYAMPVTAALGVSLEETSAALGVLHNAGRKSTQSGTDLRSALMKVMDVTKEGEKVLAAYGLKAADLNVTTRGLVPVLNTLAAANMTAADQMKFFGAEASAGALALISGRDKITEFTKALQSASGTTAKVAEVMGNNLDAALKQVGSAIEGAIIQISDQTGFEKWLTDSANATSGLIGALTGVNAEMVKSGMMTAEAAAGFESMANTVKLLGSALVGAGIFAAISQLPAALAAVSAGMTVATGATAAFSAVLLANPVGLAVAGITAVVAALYLLRDETVTIGDTTATVSQWIGSLWEQTAGRAGEAISWISSAASSFGDTLRNSMFGAFFEMAGEKLSALPGMFSKAFDAALSAVRTAVNGMINLVPTLINSFGRAAENISALFNAIKSGDVSGALAVYRGELSKIQADLSRDTIGDFGRRVAAGAQAAATSTKAMSDEMHRMMGNAANNATKTVETVSKAARAGGSLVKEHDKAATAAAKNAAKELEKVNDLIAKANGNQSQYNNNLALLSKFYNAGKISLVDYRAAVEKLIMTETEQGKAAAKAQEDAKRLIESLNETAKRLAEQAETYGMSEAAIAAYNLQKAEAALASAKEAGAIPAVIKQLEAEAEARRNVSLAANALESKKQAGEAAKAATTQWENAAKSIEQALTDSLMRGFDSGKSFADSLKSYVLNALKSLAVKVLVQPVMGAISGAGQQITSAMQPGGGGVGGIKLSDFSTGTLGAGTVQSFAQSGVGSWFGLSDASGALTQAGADLTVAAGDFADLAGSVGSWVTTGIDVFNAFKTGEGWGKAAGSAIGTLILPGIGTAIGSTLGGMLDDAFGGKGGPKTGGNYNAAFTASGAVAAENMFGGYTPAEMDKQMQQAVTGLRQGYATLTTALGGQIKDLTINLGGDIDTKGDAGNRVSAQVAVGQVGVGMSQADSERALWQAAEGVYSKISASISGDMGEALTLEVKRMMIAALRESDLPEGIAQVFSGVDLYSATAEQIDALIAKAQEMALVRQAFEALGGTFPQLAGQSWTVQQALVAAAGGMSGLQAKLQSYYDNYYTESERAKNATTALTAAINAAGVEMPKTKAEFRALVEAQDLTTEAGRATYSALINVSDAFAAVSANAEKLAAQRAQMEIELMTAKGDTAGATAATRAGKIASLDESLRDLQKQIFEAEDASAKAAIAAAIAAKQRELNIELMRATGDESGALSATRADELAAMDESLRATQKQIWAAQDAAKAAAAEAAAKSAATQAAQEAARAAEEAERERRRALEQAQRDAAAAVEDARRGVQEAYDREAGAIRTVIDRLEQFTKRVRQFRDGLYLDKNLSTLSKYDQYQLAKATFESVSARALAGDQGAQDQLEQASRDFLEYSKEYNANNTQYQMDFDNVQSILSQVQTSAQSQIDVARLQLDALNRMVDGILNVKSAVLTLAEAIAAFQATLAAQTKVGLPGTAGGTGGSGSGGSTGGTSTSTATGGYSGWREIVGASDGGYAHDPRNPELLVTVPGATYNGGLPFGTELGWMPTLEGEPKPVAIDPTGGIVSLNPSLADVPGFAMGGSHAGGLRIVGESGPELEATGPARIWTANQTMDMLRGGAYGRPDVEPLVNELRALREQLSEAQRENTRLLEAQMSQREAISELQLAAQRDAAVSAGRAKAGEI